MTDEPKKPVIRFEDAAKMPGDDEIDLRRERVSTFAGNEYRLSPRAATFISRKHGPMK